MENTNCEYTLSPEQVLKLEQLGAEVGPFLPWHMDEDPFKILTAENLLRRTARRNVLKIWSEFAQEYKSPERILEADDDRIRNLVKKLGLYNQRVRVLNEVSDHIVKRFNSKVPNTKKEIISIPHIGNYISEAVLLYSFSEEYLPLDSGIQRVLHRLCGSEVYKDVNPYKDKLCTNSACTVTSTFGPHKCVNTHRALLWTVWENCTYQAPKCRSCRLLEACVSGQKNIA